MVVIMEGSQFERSAAPQTAEGCREGVRNLAKPNCESISRDRPKSINLSGCAK